MLLWWSALIRKLTYYKVFTRSALPYDWAVAAPALTEKPFCLSCCCFLLKIRRACSRYRNHHLSSEVAPHTKSSVLQPLSGRECPDWYRKHSLPIDAKPQSSSATK